jgi:large conductance mechanosensitive channel
MPIIGAIFGGLDFSSYFVVLGKVPAALAGSTDYAALKKAGVPLLGYGAFVTQVVNFVIVAGIIFLLLRFVTRAMARLAREQATVTVEDPAELVLLREIRDELRAGRT